MKTHSTSSLTDIMLAAYLTISIGRYFSWNWLIHVSAVLAVYVLVQTLVVCFHHRSWPQESVRKKWWACLYLLAFSLSGLTLYGLYMTS